MQKSVREHSKPCSKIPHFNFIRGTDSSDSCCLAAHRCRCMRSAFHPEEPSLMAAGPSEIYSSKCTNAKPNVPFLVILITTTHKEFDARQAIRETWGDESTFSDLRIITLFLLGRSTDAVLNQMVEQESEIFHDIVVEDFIDSRRLNLDGGTSPGTSSTAGPYGTCAASGTCPRDLYPESKYPPFCSGTGYVFSADVAELIYKTSLHTRLLHLEDVYVGVCLRKLGIHPYQNSGFNHWKMAYSLCRYRRVITVHQISPEEMHRIWNDMTSKKHLKSVSNPLSLLEDFANHSSRQMPTIVPLGRLVRQLETCQPVVLPNFVDTRDK
ncbi:UDP-GalNAc:beta-1,3-N-acetylgalactosaminyltransferase 1 isoform b [Pimephales promelas]|nr:UDP-GalNAc:beta-1,3-N-acetylgalactosaminyltransferase 1 isoform b [Pimephales promelas]